MEFQVERISIFIVILDGLIISIKYPMKHLTGYILSDCKNIEVIMVIFTKIQNLL